MSKPTLKMTHGLIGEAMCCYTEGSYKDADIALIEYEAEIRADERAKTIDEEPRIKAFNTIYDICDDMIHETEWYDMLARQKFDEIKRIVFNCAEQRRRDEHEASD